MRIRYMDLQHLQKTPTRIAACIGYFDGVHKGHQELIRQTIAMAEEHHCGSAMITFDPDPVSITRPGSEVHHISTLRQKINLAVNAGIENIFILKFSYEMSRLSPREFEDKVLGSFDLCGLVCGFDFHYGYRGEGNADTLRDHCGYEVRIVDPIVDHGEKISSTRIVKLLEEGDVEEAERLLGYPYEVDGIVKKGHGKGNEIGFPTANLHIPSEYVYPHPGVYAGYALIQDKRYRAMINLGHNPTFNYSPELSLEVHLLDFNGDLYDKRMRLQFKVFVREEKKFNSVGNLKLQLEQDRYAIRRMLKS